MISFKDFKEKTELKLLKLSVSRSVRNRLYDRLAMMLENKIPLREALLKLGSQKDKHGNLSKKPIPSLCRELYNRLLSGMTISESMRDFVSHAEFALIQASDENLPKGFRICVMINESGSKLLSKIFSGLMYPAVLLTMSVSVSYFYSIKVIPTFAMRSNPDNWTGLAKALYLYGYFCQHYLLYLLAGLAVIAVLITMTLPRWTGERIPGRVFAEKLPPWSIYKLTQGSAFLFSLTAMLMANIPIRDALPKLKEGQSAWTISRIDSAIYNLREGDSSLGEALMSSGQNFPDEEIIDDLIIFSSLPDIDKTLETISKKWSSGSEVKLGKLVAVFSLIAYISVGLLVIMMAGGAMALQEEMQESNKSIRAEYSVTKSA